MPETTKPRKKKTESVSTPEKETPKVSKPMGRPTAYNTEIASKILVRISNGESLRMIVRDVGMPAQSTVYEWLLRFPDFAEHYARAREEQADTLADEIQAIADEPPERILTENGDRIDTGYLQWQKNRIDARKWVASKLKPKKYGDRVAMEGVEGGAPITTQDVSTSRLAEIIKNLEMSKRVGD